MMAHYFQNDRLRHHVLNLINFKSGIFDVDDLETLFETYKEPYIKGIIDGLR